MTTTAAAATARATATSEPWLTPKALSHVLVVAAAFCTTVALVLLVGFDGWEYYRAPLGSRGYLPQHALLRPSGAVGLTLGVAGVVSMLCTLPYAVRKRWRRLSGLGTVRGNTLCYGFALKILLEPCMIDVQSSGNLLQCLDATRQAPLLLKN